MSDYPYLLAKLRKYFPQLIVKSYEPNNANSDVSKYTLQDGQGHFLTPHRLRGKFQLSIFMAGMLVGLTQNDFPLSQSIKKGFGVNGLNTFR